MRKLKPLFVASSYILAASMMMGCLSSGSSSGSDQGQNAPNEEVFETSLAPESITRVILATAFRHSGPWGFNHTPTTSYRTGQPLDFSELVCSQGGSVLYDGTLTHYSNCTQSSHINQEHISIFNGIYDTGAVISQSGGVTHYTFFSQSYSLHDQPSATDYVYFRDQGLQWIYSPRQGEAAPSGQNYTIRLDGTIQWTSSPDPFSTSGTYTFETLEPIDILDTTPISGRINVTAKNAEPVQVEFDNGKVHVGEQTIDYVPTLNSWLNYSNQ